MSGTHNPLTVTSGPAPASPSVARSRSEHHTQTPSEHQNQTQGLYQCADCLRKLAAGYINILFGETR